MRILLFSMPDSFEHTPTVAVRMPNGALVSLAGNVDDEHAVFIADLILAQTSVRSTVERLVRELQPDLVGLSVMTFQRVTARRVISLVRALQPNVRIVVGGYDPSLAPEAYMDPEIGVDFIVRGEGDVTFRELVRALARGDSAAGIPGVWFRTSEGFVRNSAERPVADLATADVRPPRRDARVLSGYTFMGRKIDVVETSRGCTFDCSFCSIIEMRGRNFHRFPIERVIADIRDARDRGARAIFIVDDNVTLDVKRFEALCTAIVEAGLNDIDYLVQAMTSAIAAGGDRLASHMQRAGFRYVFLGIENIVDADLQFLKAAAKNHVRGGAATDNATLQAIKTLHRRGMLIVGGLIVGNPDDTPASIEANLSFAKQYIDWPYIQHPTPYPGTPMTKEFRERGLIASTRVEEYDGTTAVTRSQGLTTDDIEYERWKVERWMKLRHMPTALFHDPFWVIQNARRMMKHTFRGSTWRSVLGLESARDVFRRYKAIREKERLYLDWPDPLENRADKGDDQRSSWFDAGVSVQVLRSH